MKQDYYQVLGVLKNADENAIRKAYFKLAKKFHPDKNSEVSAKETFIQIKEAYDTLSNSNRRVIYDAEQRSKSSKFDDKFQTDDTANNFHKNAQKTKENTGKSSARSSTKSSAKCAPPKNSNSTSNNNKARSQSTTSANYQFNFFNNSADDFMKNIFNKDVFFSFFFEANDASRSNCNKPDSSHSNKRSSSRRFSFSPNSYSKDDSDDEEIDEDSSESSDYADDDDEIETDDDTQRESKQMFCQFCGRIYFDLDELSDHIRVCRETVDFDSMSGRDDATDEGNSPFRAYRRKSKGIWTQNDFGQFVNLSKNQFEAFFNQMPSSFPSWPWSSAKTPRKDGNSTGVRGRQQQSQQQQNNDPLYDWNTFSKSKRRHSDWRHQHQDTLSSIRRDKKMATKKLNKNEICPKCGEVLGNLHMCKPQKSSEKKHASNSKAFPRTASNSKQNTATATATTTSTDDHFKYKNKREQNKSSSFFHKPPGHQNNRRPSYHVQYDPYHEMMDELHDLRRDFEWTTTSDEQQNGGVNNRKQNLPFIDPQNEPVKKRPPRHFSFAGDEFVRFGLSSSSAATTACSNCTRIYGSLRAPWICSCHHQSPPS